MDKPYMPQELAAIARQTAHEVGAQAICWWQDNSNPGELYIEASTKLGNMPLLLMAILAEGPSSDTPLPER
jgi:hypothetical protein